LLRLLQGKSELTAAERKRLRQKAQMARRDKAKKTAAQQEARLLRYGRAARSE